MNTEGPESLQSAGLQLYRSSPYPCSYWPDRLACAQVATPAPRIQTGVYSELVRLGFRRSGLTTYRPDCGHCQACQPLRVDVAQFEPQRHQRRAWAQHADLQAHIGPLAFDAAQFALFRRYQNARHPGGGMDRDQVAHYRDFLLSSRVDSRLVQFTHPEEGLKMVSVVDILSDGLSAVYTFYEPQARTSYGTWSVLWQIDWARQLGLPYVYLGYWIPDSPKMHYKARFKPHELLRAGRWTRP